MKEFIPSGFQWAANDGNTKSLTYSLDGMVKESPRLYLEAKVQLWFDPVSMKPARRVVSIKFTEGGDYFNKETFDEFTLDAEIPDGKFKLPEAEK